MFESYLEFKALIIMLADNSIAHIIDQPDPVGYFDACGELRHHTFDYLCITTDGKKIAIAIKPQELADEAKIDDLLQIMRPQIPREFADYAVLRTDAHITDDRFHNAQLILQYRQTRCSDAMDTILTIMRRVTGAVELGRVVATACLKSDGFAAIVNLIDDAVISFNGARISYRTPIQLNMNV